MHENSECKSDLSLVYNHKGVIIVLFPIKLCTDGHQTSCVWAVFKPLTLLDCMFECVCLCVIMDVSQPLISLTVIVVCLHFWSLSHSETTASPTGRRYQQPYSRIPQLLSPLKI